MVDTSPAKAAAVPEGFRILVRHQGFIAHNGPVYVREAPAPAKDRHAPMLGFLVEERHCNRHGTLHGGMLMTLSDLLLIFCARRDLGTEDFMPTVSLAGDFLAPVRVGDWIVGSGAVVHATRSLCFVEGCLSVRGEPVLRTNTTLRMARRAS